MTVVAHLVSWETALAVSFLACIACAILVERSRFWLVRALAFPLYVAAAAAWCEMVWMVIR